MYFFHDTIQFKIVICFLFIGLLISILLEHILIDLPIKFPHYFLSDRLVLIIPQLLTDKHVLIILHLLKINSVAETL